MAEYGTPDWVNPQNSSNTGAVSDANIGEGVKASAAGGWVLVLYCIEYYSLV